MTPLQCPNCNERCVYVGDEFCGECHGPLPKNFGRVPTAPPTGFADPFATPTVAPVAEPAAVAVSPPTVATFAPVAAAVPQPPAAPPIAPPPVAVAVPAAGAILGLRCLSCRALVERPAEACTNCGQKLKVACTKCGTETLVTQKFCKKGGNKCPLLAESIEAALVREPAATAAIAPPVTATATAPTTAPVTAFTTAPTTAAVAAPDPFGTSAAQPVQQAAPAALALLVLDPRGHEAGRFPLKPGDNEVGAESPGDGIFPDIDLTVLDPGEVISRRMVCLRLEPGRITMTVRTKQGTVQIDGAPVATGATVDVPPGADLRFAHLTAKVVTG